MVTLAILLLEVAGGFLANSLALLSDAGHVLTDLAALVLTFMALRLAARPATDRKTYGFRRLEILSALVNGVTLVFVSLFIFFEAYRRLRHPEPVQGTEVFVIATLGLIGNGIGVILLHDSGHNLNVRGAFLHLVGDTVSSVGVILSGLIIAFTGWWVIDPLVSIGIACVIIVGAVRLIDESVDILLEGTPRHIDMDKVMAEISGVAGVCSVHDVHIWCVTPELCMMSGHVVLADTHDLPSNEVLLLINKLMARDFGIEHTTIQMEYEHCGRDDADWLALE
jgi:cobalt-zinc-cadmium efflux system protein